MKYDSCLRRDDENGGQMNPYLKEMAKELAKHINQVVNIPWLSEEQEQMFFELVVTKVFELTLGSLLKQIDPKKEEVT